MSENNVKIKVINKFSVLIYSVLGWAAAVLFAIGGAFSAKYFGLPDLLGAQITMGVFGFVGGLSHSLLIRAAGGKVFRKQALFLSVVWALSCIGGVTPLFFIFGTSLKMAVLAFYSFATFGALGGVATAFMMRFLFDNASSRNMIPCVIVWSYSFGVAAGASDIIGGGLQGFLPAIISWSIATGSMALIIGSGSWYSLIQFLRTDKGVRQVFERSRANYEISSEEKNNRYILILILLSVPFYVNDFSNIYVKDWRLWISIDYTIVKLFPLLVVLWLIRRKKMQPSKIGLTTQPVISFVIVFLTITLVCAFIDQNVGHLIRKLPGYSPMGKMPLITNPIYNWIDLTFGLLMVGVFEELIFRGYMYIFISQYTNRPLAIVVISSIAFGFIHWSSGFHVVFVTSIIGGIFMIAYMITRSLPALMLAHFVVDFIDSADLISNSIFTFY